MSKDLENSLVEEAQNLESEAGVNTSSDAELTPEQSAAFNNELELEQKYGASPIQTAAESALSAATFGISDQLLANLSPEMKEALRERRKRNAEADVVGTIAGIVGPSLLTGGTSAAAQATSAGVRGAAKAGLFTEKITKKALDKIIAETGKKKLAKEVLRKSLSKGAGSAVEGAFYGAGELVSENALGNADINAENLLATAGPAAILSGVAGGLFGGIHALAPSVSKSGKVKDLVSKRIKGFSDPVRNAQELQGMTATQISKQNQFSPLVAENTPELLKTIARKNSLSAFHSNETLLSAAKSHMDDLGKAIETSLDDITRVAKESGANILPSKQQVAYRVIQRLDDLKSQFSDDAGKALPGASEKFNKIQKVVDEWMDDLSTTSIYDAKTLNQLKRKYQDLAKWDRRGNLPLGEEINREISRGIRDEVLEMAENAGGELGAKLKQELLDYGTAANFVGNFSKNIDKQSQKQFLNMRDLLLGGAADAFLTSGQAAGAVVTKKLLESDFKRRLMILSGIEKANKIVDNKVSSSIKNFLTKKPGFKQATVRTITDSDFARSEKGKKPSSKSEAFINIQKNLEELQDINRSSSKYDRGNIAVAAPETSAMVQVGLGNSVAFLLEKLPKEASMNPMSHVFRKWKPSTQEIAKFERYLRAVEKPLSVLDDLEEGKINREGIEALKVVYPQIYAKVQASVMNEVANDPEKLTYQKKLQLGVLLDVPTDATLMPQNIAALQSHYSEAQESQAGGIEKLSKSKAASMDMAESEATTVQKAEKR